MKLLNYIHSIIKLLNRDPKSKIAIKILGYSTALLTSGGIGLYVSLNYTKSNGEGYSISPIINDASTVAILLGAIGFITGLVLSILRYKSLSYESNAKDIGFFNFPGFINQNPDIPSYVLEPEESTRIKEVSFKTIDSYDREIVIDDYAYKAKVINERISHNETKSAIVSALGSIPYLFLTGTLFSDGHLPLQILEHNRDLDQWHKLDPYGNEVGLVYKIKDKEHDINSISVVSNDKGQVGLSVSITNEILLSDLPSNIRNSTIDVSISSEYDFDALDNVQVQSQVARSIYHLITRLSKQSNEVHLFLCAQASFIVRLGKLYQAGMTGKLIIHNYNSSSKKYDWNISINGKKVS